MVELAKQALEHNLSRKQIKERIKEWRPDTGACEGASYSLLATSYQLPALTVYCHFASSSCSCL